METHFDRVVGGIDDFITAHRGIMATRGPGHHQFAPGKAVVRQGDGGIKGGVGCGAAKTQVNVAVRCRILRRPSRDQAKSPRHCHIGL